jgi:ribonuclease J
MGWDKDHVFVADNGQVMEFSKDKGELMKEKVPTEYVFVDGLGVGDVSEVVLRDRQHLAEDGMVVVIAKIERKTGKLLGKPDIVSRGFIFMKDQVKLVDDLRTLVEKTVIDNDPKSAADTSFIRNTIRDEAGKFLFKRTERRPMVLPVIIEL